MYFHGFNAYDFCLLKRDPSLNEVMAVLDDIPAQLGALLGNPPRVSVIDVGVLVTGKDARKTAQDIGFVKDLYPDVAQNLGTNSKAAVSETPQSVR